MNNLGNGFEGLNLNCETNMNSNLWSQVSEILKMQLGNSVFSSWIAPLAFEKFQDCKITLAAPNSFIASYVEANFKNDILNCMSSKFDDVIDLEFCVKQATENFIPEAQNTSSFVAEEPAEQPSWFLQSVLKNEWTFENFVVDESNEFAYKAAKGIAENPSFFYNPVFLYAGIGLGKTHLLHAIANHIASSDKSRKVLYISARQFANYYVKSLFEKNTTQFKSQFAAYDVLLIDDLQFLDAKKSTQEEFFGILSDLVMAGKQIVIAGNRSLSSLTDFDKKLKSFIISGLSLDIARPEFSTRVKILESKQKILKANIETKYINLIAEKISSNVRELEGAYRRILAYQELTGLEVNEVVINNVLKDMVEVDEKIINADDVVKAVSKYFGISVSQITSMNREKNICYARQIAMFVLKQMTKLSFPEIGKKLGKDHATAIYAVKQIEARSHFESQISTDLNNIKDLMDL